MKVVMESIVKEAARRYARRCWWASKDDLMQEGWLAALTAQRTWKANGAAGFRWYVWRAVINAMRNLLLRESAPVKAGWHNLHKLKGLTRAPVSELRGWVHPGLSQEERLALARWDASTRDIAKKVVAAGKHATEVSMVLFEGQRVSAVSEETGIKRRSLLRACKNARDRIREHPDAQDLWESR